MFNKDKMIKQFGKVPYATVYNFQPWTAVNKKADLKSSLLCSLLMTMNNVL